MIILTEVAQKLENILNGLDNEVGPSGTQVVATNPTGYNFVVKTEGFHIDSIARKDREGNFIPVFVSSMGGQFNPIKGLKQASYSIPIAIYYPVRFKDDFFVLGDFLADAFVGTTLNYGTISGVAVSNISVPQYGEIQNLDFKEFKTWVNDNYKKAIEVMEPYMVMNLTLFLSNAASGLIFGNNVKVDLSITIPGGGGTDETYVLEDIDWDGASLQSNTQPSPEQEEGTNESAAVPFGTSYGVSFKVYPNLEKLAKNETTKYFYEELLKVWLAGNIQTLTCVVTLTIAGNANLVYTRTCFIQSIVSPIEKGQLFALTLTFAKISV